MTSKILLQTNPVQLMADFQTALQHGYRFVSARSQLFEHVGGLLEIDLYRQDIEIPEIKFEDMLGDVCVVDYCKTKFLLEVQALIVNEYEIDLDSVSYDIVGTKRCRLVRQNHPSLKKYTKEELDNMDFEALKYIGKMRKCFNRSRSVMQEQILRFQQED